MTAPRPEPAPLQHMRDLERDCGRDVWREVDASMAFARKGGATWAPYIHAPLLCGVG